MSSPRPNGGSPERRPRPISTTASLPFQQAKNLANALLYARTILPPDTAWAHAVVVLDQSETHCPDARAYIALQARILRAMRDFLHGRGLPCCLLWTREIGPRHGLHHTHLLLPLPPDQADDLAAVIYRAGQLRDLPNNKAAVVRRCGWKGRSTAAALAGVLRDWLKTMSPRARINGQAVMPALATDNRGQPPCRIEGKRSGTSENIAPKARKAAGWRELTTLAELRQAMPTGAEARRERQRNKRRRHRSQRAPDAAPRTVPVRPGPFTACDDLAADFLEG